MCVGFFGFFFFVFFSPIYRHIYMSTRYLIQSFVGFEEQGVRNEKKEGKKENKEGKGEKKNTKDF